MRVYCGQCAMNSYQLHLLFAQKAPNHSSAIIKLKKGSIKSMFHEHSIVKAVNAKRYCKMHNDERPEKSVVNKHKKKLGR